MKASAIITAKNESRTIVEAIRAAKPFVDEVIVVDGHSTDETVALSEREGAVVVADGGLGKGEATRLGIEKASGELVLILTADGSDEYARIPDLLAPLRGGEADLVVGSRFQGGSDELSVTAAQLIRTMGNISLNVMINWWWGSYLTDVLNGFRAIRKDTAADLEMRTNSAAVEVEMVVKALARGYRVINVPTHEFARKFGETRLTVWKEGIKIYWCVFRNLFDARGPGARPGRAVLNGEPRMARAEDIPKTSPAP